MNRRTQYKEDSKCNFCFNWFQLSSENKHSLSVCDLCLHKGLNTSSLKMASPSGTTYQVYLVKKTAHLQKQQQTLLNKVDEYMHTQIRGVLDKWETITNLLIPFNRIQNQQQICRATQNILKGDFRVIEANHLQAIKEIQQQIIDKEKHRIQLNSRNCNPSSRNLSKSKSVKKLVNKNESNLSLKPYNDAKQKNVNQTLIPQNGKQIISRLQVSPSNLKRSVSFKGINQNKENKEYKIKVQNIKNHIVDCLQDRDQNTINEPVRIMKQKVFKAIENTKFTNKSIELVSYLGLQNLDIQCYLRSLDWEGVEILKLVKVGLTDDQLLGVLDFISDKNIETLVLTSNNLSEESCKALLQSKLKNLKNIYMGKNQVMSSKAKSEIKEVHANYNLFL